METNKELASVTMKIEKLEIEIEEARRHKNYIMYSNEELNENLLSSRECSSMYLEVKAFLSEKESLLLSSDYNDTSNDTDDMRKLGVKINELSGSKASVKNCKKIELTMMIF